MTSSSNITEETVLTATTLPLVSFVIVNYNYGRFLGEAVRSVYAQTYTNIECIVVNNASTDDSSAILAKLQTEFPTLRVIHEATNRGQSAASKRGFDLSKGDYLAFIDADDVVLPEFAEMHVLVHLSSKKAVGATSGDMLQLGRSGVVTSTDHAIRRFLAEPTTPLDLVRPFDEACPRLWPYPTRARDLAASLHYVPPLMVHWVWAATSGNVFRRDAIAPLFRNNDLDALFCGTDEYLLRGASGLSGSIIIDKPLAVYRIHGSNLFTRHPPLDHTLTFEREGINNHEESIRQLLNQFIGDAPFYVRWFADPMHLMRLARAIDKESQAGGHLRVILSNNVETVQKAFGFWMGSLWMLTAGVAITKLFGKTSK
jgi:hypothetical protein